MFLLYGVFYRFAAVSPKSSPKSLSSRSSSSSPSSYGSCFAFHWAQPALEDLSEHEPAVVYNTVSSHSTETARTSGYYSGHRRRFEKVTRPVRTRKFSSSGSVLLLLLLLRTNLRLVLLALPKKNNAPPSFPTSNFTPARKHAPSESTTTIAETTTEEISRQIIHTFLPAFCFENLKKKKTTISTRR